MELMSYHTASILIVDDVPDNLLLLSEILCQQNFQVRQATSGTMAINTIGESQPDLILLDLQMPHMDGYEVCRRLKNDEKTKLIPIIVLSALNESVDKLKAFSLGVVDYISKPFDIEEVVARVNNQLQLQTLRRTLEKRNQSLNKAMEDLEGAYNESSDLRNQLEKANRELKAANRKLEALATIDGLTQIANRRRFDDYLAQKWQECWQRQQPICLLLGDIDFFKPYNDHYGHQMGDRCLCQVAKILESSLLRPQDLAARYGGEEFAVVLPQTSLEDAKNIALQIIENVRNVAIAHATSPVSSTVSLSLGVHGLIPTEAIAPNTLIECCDQALYAAKAQGRDRLIFYSEI
jgi:diguanylate cyclase (GGDEF)-like protein